MSITRAQELRKRRDELHEQNAALLVAVKERWEGRENVKDERRLDFNFDREATAEERAEWDKRDKDSEKLKAEIETLEAGEERMKRHEERGRELAASAGAIGRAAPISDGSEIRSRVESRANMSEEEQQAADNDELRRYLLGGIRALTPEQRMDLAVRQTRSDGASLPAELQARFVEFRAQAVGTDAAGGYLVPEGFYNRLALGVKAFGGMRRSRATILRTATGQKLPMPTIDDTGNTGNLLAENAEIAETDVVASEKELDAYLYVSDLVRVSIELLQDSAFDIGALMARLLGERLGRKTNAAYTTGTGSSQPNGAVTASALGKTAASATAITYLEMIDLKMSVDEGYWNAGQGEWMFNTAGTYKAVKKLLDGDNRPIFNPDVQSGRVDRIDGDRFITNPDMDSPAASKKVMLYGDFSNFFIRDVMAIELVVLLERFAEFRQRGFFGMLRTDSELLDPGTNPIKHYIMAAS